MSLFPGFGGRPQPHPVSLATVYAVPDFNGQDLNVSGTGSVIRTKHGPVLVTAGHVLTGRHPNGDCRHSQAALPNRITLTKYFGKLASDIPLYAGDNDPNSDTPRYFRHTRPAVDLAVLPLPSGAGHHVANTLHDSVWRPSAYPGSEIPLEVATPCYIIGYPEGLTNHVGRVGLLLLWKTGNIANGPQFPFSNPKLGLQDDQVCLVDATGRPGMSGGPVFLIQTRLTEEWKAISAVTQLAIETAHAARVRPSAISGSPLTQAVGRRHRLVGFYTGRTSETSDIGLVWKLPLLHQILSDAFGTEW